MIKTVSLPGPLAVDPAQLLATGEDPGFNNGSSASRNGGTDELDLAIGQDPGKPMTGLIVCEVAEHRGLDAKVRKIQGDIGGPSSRPCITGSVDDGNGGFR
jgi:hypothetical protein